MIARVLAMAAIWAFSIVLTIDALALRRPLKAGQAALLYVVWAIGLVFLTLFIIYEVVEPIVDALMELA